MDRPGNEAMRALLDAIRRLFRDTAGNIAVTLAYAMVPLCIAGVGAVDVARVLSAKARLQDALDTAALTAARDAVRDPTKLQEYGAEAFRQNMLDARALKLVSGPTFTLEDDRVVVAEASAQVADTIAADLLLGSDLTVNARSEVRSSGFDVEVSLVVDVTGSMLMFTPDGQRRIDALKGAAANLVDIVVQEDQHPFSSRMALVPYAAAVNVGAEYADRMRGKPDAGVCSEPGCETYRFKSLSGPTERLDITTCVTERTGVQAYTDEPASLAHVGRHYGLPATCPTVGLTSLTDDRAALKTAIQGLPAVGSTAGHIGLAWGWYMVSPNFKGPSREGDYNPGRYNTDKRLKVVVMMSDGEFNTVYCKGVVAQNSTNGSGTSDHKNSCDAENGLPYAQANSLCNAIKAKDIIIYTVLFGETDPDAIAFMRGCATDNAKVYLPRSGMQLKDAFASIGADITKLRLSR